MGKPILTPARVRALWAADLESGLHKQGCGALHQSLATGGDAFCCLGRLCVLAVENGVIPAPKHGFFGWYYDSCKVSLPPAVQEWAGLSGNNGCMTDGDSLAEMNDNGVSFAKIADIIERRPPGLFIEPGRRRVGSARRDEARQEQANGNHDIPGRPGHRNSAACRV